MNRFDEPWTADDVPSGPYFQGTRHRIEVGDALKVDMINPSEGDERRVLWAATDCNQALDWARRRNRSVPTCNTFIRRLGFGGTCPCCDEPVTLDELLNPQLPATTPEHPARYWGQNS